MPMVRYCFRSLTSHPRRGARGRVYALVRNERASTELPFVHSRYRLCRVAALLHSPSVCVSIYDGPAVREVWQLCLPSCFTVYRCPNAAGFALTGHKRLVAYHRLARGMFGFSLVVTSCTKYREISIEKPLGLDRNNDTNQW